MLNNQPKVLCLSFWTPPIVRPQSILIGKMIPEWRRQGISPIIITYKECGDWDIDVPVYKIPQFKTNRVFAKIPFLSSFFEYFYYRKLFKISQKIIEKHEINIIFSFSNPQASNILGAIIKRRLGIKFISHFSDPWVDNYYKSFSRLALIKVKFLEKFVVENSDRVIFITEEAKNLVMKKYNTIYHQLTEVIPHCFDYRDYPKMRKNNSKFVISYIGAFYKQRNPEMLLSALGIINKKLEYAGKFELKLVGSVNEYAGYNIKNLEIIINKNGLKGVVDLIPVVEYKKSLEYMKLSDCLVVIDADVKNSPFLTSKVVDYAGSENIVIGITPESSPTTDFLNKLGYKVFNYNQTEQLVRYLMDLIDGNIKHVLNREYLTKFEVKNTTAKLINIFKSV